MTHEWLVKLYEEREHWIPTFLKGYFFVGIYSTQPSESMNAFFDGYLNNSTTLKAFVEQFNNALRHKIENETKSNFKSFKGKLDCMLPSSIEIQFQEAYTHDYFKQVRIKFMGRRSCFVGEIVRGSEDVKYKI